MEDYFDINEIIDQAAGKSLNECDEGLCMTCGEVLNDYEDSDGSKECKSCQELSNEFDE